MLCFACVWLWYTFHSLCINFRIKKKQNTADLFFIFHKKSKKKYLFTFYKSVTKKRKLNFLLFLLSLLWNNNGLSDGEDIEDNNDVYDDECYHNNDYYDDVVANDEQLTIKYKIFRNIFYLEYYFLFRVWECVYMFFCFLFIFLYFFFFSWKFSLLRLDQTILFNIFFKKYYVIFKKKMFLMFTPLKTPSIHYNICLKILK